MGVRVTIPYDKCTRQPYKNIIRTSDIIFEDNTPFFFDTKMMFPFMLRIYVYCLKRNKREKKLLHIF